MQLYYIISLLGFVNIFFYKAAHRFYHTVDLSRPVTSLGSVQDAEHQTCKSGPTQYFTCRFNFKHVTSPINY